MSKKFILCHDPIGPDQEEAFKASLSGVDYWHWLPTVWLIKDPSKQLSAVAIRDKFKGAAPSAKCFVSEGLMGPWAAMLPVVQFGGPMEEWLRTHWETP